MFIYGYFSCFVVLTMFLLLNNKRLYRNYTKDGQYQMLTEHLGYIRQLSGMANNVNQIAHKAHVAGYGESHSQCMAMIAELDKLVNQIEQ